MSFELEVRDNGEKISSGVYWMPSCADRDLYGVTGRCNGAHGFHHAMLDSAWESTAAVGNAIDL